MRFFFVLVFLLGNNCDPSLAYGQTQQWRLSPSSLGSGVKAIAINPTYPDTVYAFGYGDFMRSTNRGETWDSVNSLSSSYDALAIDPVYHERFLNTAVGGPPLGPILRLSSDGGHSWNTLLRGEGFFGRSVIELDPGSPRGVYVGLEPNLFYSQDFFETWDTLPHVPGGALTSLSIANSNPNILMAAKGYGSIKRSTDRGLSWIDVSPPLQMSNGSVVQIDPSDENIAYAGIYSTGSEPGGVYKTTNGGSSWEEMNNGLSSDNWRINKLRINPKNPNELFLCLIATQRILFRSTTGGANWLPFDAGLPTSGFSSGVLELQIDTLNNRVYAGAATNGSTDTTGVFIMDFVLSAPLENSKPVEIKLEQNYPNPFNATCRIRAHLVKRGFTHVRLYDVLGRLVRTIAEGILEAGVYEYEVEAPDLSSGVYYYRLDHEGISLTRKMMLLK